MKVLYLAIEIPQDRSIESVLSEFGRSIDEDAETNAIGLLRGIEFHYQIEEKETKACLMNLCR